MTSFEDLLVKKLFLQAEQLFFWTSLDGAIWNKLFFIPVSFCSYVNRLWVFVRTGSVQANSLGYDSGDRNLVSYEPKLGQNVSIFSRKTLSKCETWKIIPPLKIQVLPYCIYGRLCNRKKSVVMRKHSRWIKIHDSRP